MAEIKTILEENKFQALQSEIKRLKRDICIRDAEYSDEIRKLKAEQNLFWTTLATYRKEATKNEQQRRLI